MTDMITLAGIQFRLGQKWKENDKRFHRVVTVRGWNPETGKVQIESEGRFTWAAATRFGKANHGYSLAEEIAP